MLQLEQLTACVECFLDCPLRVIPHHLLPVDIPVEHAERSMILRIPEILKPGQEKCFQDERDVFRPIRAVE